MPANLSSGSYARFPQIDHDVELAVMEEASEVKCRQCGTVCRDKRSYRKFRKAFAASEHVLCLGCMGKNKQQQNGTVLITYLAIAILGGIYLRFNPGEGPLWVLFHFTVLYLWFIPATALHELGHAAVALALRWKVFKVQVGWFGKPLLRKTIWGIDWEWNSVPIGGMAFVYPKNRAWFPLKAALVYLAGPAVNFLVAWLCLENRPGSINFFGPRFELSGMFILANFFCGAINLLPFRSSYMSIPLDTDGRAFLKALFRSGLLYQNMRIGCCVMACMKHRSLKQYAEARRVVEGLLEEYPDDFNLLNMRAIIHLDQGEYAEARTLFLQLAGKEGLKLHEEATIANNIAWSDIRMGKEEHVEEALEFSNKAMSILGAMSAVQGTRGAALVLGGKAEEGILLLKNSMELNQTGPVDQAHTASWIAIGEYKRGNLSEGDNWARRVKELDPECTMLERIGTARAQSASASLPMLSLT